jgi:hypothetical protein
MTGLPRDSVGDCMLRKVATPQSLRFQPKISAKTFITMPRSRNRTIARSRTWVQNPSWRLHSASPGTSPTDALGCHSQCQNRANGLFRDRPRRGRDQHQGGVHDVEAVVVHELDQQEARPGGVGLLEILAVGRGHRRS